VLSLGGRNGVGYYNFNIFKGVRDSAAKALLGPLLHESEKYSNFELKLHAEVMRVVLEEREGVAR
jgi:choline dehydrogenase-like flavoprotein